MFRFLATKPKYYSTIYALSSGYGKCGVAVIRVSGSETSIALKALTGLKTLPQPRNAILRSIKHPISGEVLDKGLILWFPGPNSFTGEDCCEFHVHGGIAVINAVFAALSSISKLRLAEAGEFTKKAFFNGKLDLTEVEGLADLLQAETEIQRKQAFLQTQGSLSRLYNNWRAILLRQVAHIEAHIDFEETETIDNNVLNNVFNNITKLRLDILKHLEDGRKGELLRNGVKGVILGAPNAGKSSLLNLICKRPAAIVTPIEGTTRDVLEVTVNIGGYPLILADTAGLRACTEDVIETEGIARAKEAYKNSDLVILMIDTIKYLKFHNENRNLNIIHYIQHYLKVLKIEDLLHSNGTFTKQCMVIFNKVDLINEKIEKTERDNLIFISCKSEEGIEELVQTMTSKLKLLCGEPDVEHPSMNQIRHRQYLNSCILNIEKFIHVGNEDTVLMAEYLRRALKNLGHLVGASTTDQILDVIFKDFCIGK